MADITMCLGGDCPQKDNCYRNTATPSPYRQSYFTNKPMEVNEDGKFVFCNYFWDTRLLNG